MNTNYFVNFFLTFHQKYGTTTHLGENSASIQLVDTTERAAKSAFGTIKEQYSRYVKNDGVTFELNKTKITIVAPKESNMYQIALELKNHQEVWAIVKKFEILRTINFSSTEKQFSCESGDKLAICVKLANLMPSDIDILRNFANNHKDCQILEKSDKEFDVFDQFLKNVQNPIKTQSHSQDQNNNNNHVLANFNEKSKIYIKWVSWKFLFD